MIDMEKSHSAAYAAAGVDITAMRAKAAYSPAEALLSRLATKPCKGVKPAVRAAMPSEKDVYKRQGMSSSKNFSAPIPVLSW